METAKSGRRKIFRVRTTVLSVDSLVHSNRYLTGLQRVRDSLLSQLRELNKSKPRNNADENLLVEITRLESSLTLAKDDLVSNFVLLFVVDC